MKAELVPENGDPPIPIDKDLTVIGRRAYCDIVIPDHSLSKRHCVVVKTDGLLIIRDLATTNGTKVKGQRVRWAALLPGDRIALGNYKLRVYLGPDHTPGPSESHHGSRVEARSRTSAEETPDASLDDPRLEFPTPSPLGVPVVTLPGDMVSLDDPLVPDNSLLLDDDDDDSDDSGWQKLIASRERNGNEPIIELD
ncbi:MAG: hypothetical protein NVSMB9_37390 [Isosphaeraceae bacterium]